MRGPHQTTRSTLYRAQSCPKHDGAVTKSAKKESREQVARPVNRDQLVLETRLRYGKISYEEEDVKYRMERWEVPEEIERNLLQKWRSTANAELLIYQEKITGNHVTEVTEDKHWGESIAGTFQNATSTARGSFPSRIASAFLDKKKTLKTNFLQTENS